MNIDDSVVILIKAISLDFDKLGNQMLAPYNLTYPQFKTMKLIYMNQPRTIRQIDIERHFSLTNPTVTGIIQNLEKKGLIERIINPEDSRSKVISITQKAKDIEDGLMGLGLEIEKKATGNLTAEEKGQLVYLLKKLQ